MKTQYCFQLLVSLWVFLTASWAGADPLPGHGRAESIPPLSHHPAPAARRYPPGNPAAVETVPGTGQLGTWLGIPAASPWRLGGVWVGNGSSQLVHGASRSSQQGLAQQLLLDLSLDLDQSLAWKGAKIWIQGLHVNATSGASAATGSVQGSNSLLSPEPLNRTEIYSYALAQRLFQDQFTIRVGKLVPSNDFANVVTPDAGPRNWPYWIPSVSSLTYTPLYAMPTLIGRLPGYPNSALGASISIQPHALDGKVALNAGVFDGRGGTGIHPAIQTGLANPSVSGPLFSIAQLGFAWSVGAAQQPGSLAVGGWHQAGPLSRCDQQQPGSCLSEDSAYGGFLIAAQRLINFRYPQDNSGISAFLQTGATSSNTNVMTASLGGGITMFAPMRSRPLDSYGLGISWARMNNEGYLASALNPAELMLQVYGQLHLAGNIYIQPAVTYLPTVGSKAAAGGSTNVLLQMIALF